jgi:hypothetical protein
MENLPEIKRTKLPTIEDLRSDKEYIAKNNQLNVLLNNQPKQEWLKEHPIIKVKKRIDGRVVDLPYLYLPIERIEWLLTSIFSKWRVEIISHSLIANSVSVHVRVHYLDPITGEWDWQDGIGAAPLQTNKDAGASDWNQIKSASVQIGLPAAKSYAVKDAVEQLGKLFGKDINRPDSISYSNLNPEANKMKLERELSQKLSKLHPDLKKDYIKKYDEMIESGQSEIEAMQTIIKEIS